MASSPDPAIREARDDARRTFDFDIPAQALDSALDQYASISGRAAVFRSTLVAGKRSAPVRGRHTAEAALRLLVSEAGLTVEVVETASAPALVLQPLRPASGPNPGAASRAATRAEWDRYDGLVQAGIWQALCRHEDTAQPGYRALMRFGIDATGRVSQPRLLTSSGDGGRDATLLRMARGVRIAYPPPPGLPQPLTMLIQARGEAGAPACTQGAH